MKCKDCGQEVVCKYHGTKGVDEYQHDDDESWFYSCSKCIEDGAGAFGSIVHGCNDMFGMFSEKGKEVEIGGVIMSTRQTLLTESSSGEGREMNMTKEKLDEYAQIEFSVVGTEGAIENKFKVYTKEELLKRFDELLPEKFGFSIVFALDPKEEGI